MGEGMVDAERMLGALMARGAWRCIADRGDTVDVVVGYDAIVWGVHIGR